LVFVHCGTTDSQYFPGCNFTLSPDTETAPQMKGRPAPQFSGLTVAGAVPEAIR